MNIDGETLHSLARVVKTQGIKMRIELVSPGGWGDV